MQSFFFFNIMPIIGIICLTLIISILLIVKSKEKQTLINGIDTAQFNSLAEELKRENAEIKKDLQTVKEKVAAIDEMMKEI